MTDTTSILRRATLALFLLAGCRSVGSGAAAPTQQGSASASLAARLALLEADRSVATASATRGLADGMAPLLHEEAALLLPESDVIHGAAAARAQLASAEGPRTLWWSPLHAELSADSSVGWTYGVAFSRERSDSAPPRTGKYLAAWRRTPQGWRLAAFVATVGLPRASSTGSGRGTLPPLADRSAAADFARADREFAALARQRGAADAFAAFAAPDAVTFPGSGDLARGPDDIRARLADFSRVSRWEWAPVLAVAAGSGELGYTVGEAIIRVRSGEKTDTTYSKYLTIWRRLPDGRIAFTSDAGNARPKR